MSSFITLPSTLRFRLTRSLANIKKRFTRLPLYLIPLLLFLSLAALALIALLFYALFPTNRILRPTLSSAHIDTTIKQAILKWKSPLPPAHFEDELWNQVKNDVVIGIKTGHEVSRSRLHKLRTSGWWSVGRHVPNFAIISDKHDPDLGVIGIKDYAINVLLAQQSKPNRSDTHASSNTTQNQDVNMPDHWFDRSGWRGDKDKNLPAFHLLRSVYPARKWYLLLDDDTYIFLENFARYILQDGMDKKPVYTGKVFYISRCGGFARDGTAPNRSEPKGMFAHGGSGIVVNQMAMHRLYERIPSCIRSFSSCWAGDMQVALCLRQAGIRIKKVGGTRGYDRHFIPFWPSKALADRRYGKRWKTNEEPITFHKIPDEEQVLMSALEKKAIETGDTIGYTDLRLHLMNNGIVPCHTAHNKKTRYYWTEFMPHNLK